MAINYELLNSGATTVSGSFNLYGKNPLDSRLVIPAFDGLQTLIDNGAAYEGMIVYISSEKKHYEVKTIDGVLSYRQFGLTNDELNELITNATTAAMEFKGVAATLPENPGKGDMYKVSGETIDITIDGVAAKAGDSIVYNGEQWFLIPSGDDIEDTWRPVTDVNNDATLTFKAGEKLDVAVTATGDITYSHEAIAAPELLAENEQTRTYITEVETDGYGHITGYKTATENVEDTNTTYEFECASEHSNVYFTVKEKLNGEEVAEHTVCVDAYSKNEVDAELAKKLDAGSWKNIDDDITYESETQFVAITPNGVTVNNIDTTAYTSIIDTQVKVADAEGETVLAKGKLYNNDNVGGESFSAVIHLPTKSGTLALTSDVESAVATKLDAGNWSVSESTLSTGDEECQITLNKFGITIYSDADVTLNNIGASGFYTENQGQGLATNYLAGSINNNEKEIMLPEKEGTFALTSDVDTALQAAKDYADAKSHENTTYEFAATENALEFTVTPSEGGAQTVTLVAPVVDTGVMKVTAGTDIVVTPEAGIGEITISHKEYQTGTVKDAAHDSATDPSFITGISIENGHVTGATVQNLASVLAGMSFIFDGGTSKE